MIVYRSKSRKLETGTEKICNVTALPTKKCNVTALPTIISSHPRVRVPVLYFLAIFEDRVVVVARVEPEAHPVRPPRGGVGALVLVEVLPKVT